MLGSFGIASAFLTNQEAGDSQSGGEKSGPTVQAPRVSNRPAATGKRLIDCF
jgi:hypothetical protein